MVETPKVEEAKATAEPISEIKSPIKDDSPNQQLNKTPVQNVDLKDIPPSPTPGGNKRSGPMKRMSMRIGQPSGGKNTPSA